MKCRYVIFTLLSIIFLPLCAQEKEIDYAAELAKLELELDSAGIFSLIDSVLNYDFQVPSEMNLRFGYNSNVISAGRNFGIDQHGLTSGMTFYHNSGIFADVTGFWNSEADPRYNLTMASLGYMGTFKTKWTYGIGVERWFYNKGGNDSIRYDFENNVSASLGYDFKWLNVSADYSYLFGNASAHRLIGSLTGRILFRDVWFLDRVMIYPYTSVLLGNNDYTIFFNTDQIDDFETTKYIAENFFRDPDYQMAIRQLLTPRQQQQIQSITDNNELRARAKIELIKTIIFSNEDAFLYTLNLLDEQVNAFGILNYSFSLPIIFSKDKFSFMLSYTYSVPIALPGDEIQYDPIGFFGASLSYRIPFR